MNNNKDKLEKVSEKFFSDTFFVPAIGAEIEFYMQDTDVGDIRAKCENANVKFIDIKKEEGDNQWEISIPHESNPALIADEILKIRRIFDKADFSAMPLKDSFGNSLHIHVSLFDKEGKNIFTKNGDDESIYMKYAIGGLLETMPQYMNVFAPYEECYDRLKYGKDAPSTISWGGNNRTVALRLPTTTTEPENRRIEHRVAAADTDPYLVVSAILEGMSFGILNEILPKTDKVYGDASLDMYKMAHF